MSDLSNAPEIDAAAKGQVVVHPEPNEVFLDIDDIESDRFARKMIAELERLCLEYIGPQALVSIARDTPSRGGGRHIVVRVPWVLTSQARVALQAALGSDRKRELLGLMRIFLELDRPASVFFEEPQL